jgi:hypothetical protein
MLMNRRIGLMLLIAPLFAAAQETTHTSSKKNVVKFLVTPTVFYDGAITFGYERVLKKSRSINVAAGRVKFPNIFTDSNILDVQSETDKGGFMAAADFRFYLEGENRHPAPHGIYMGPFMSYYQFRRDWELIGNSSATPTAASLQGEMAFLNIGAQIGYQFVVKDRFTFDFIFFGPSITNYRLDLALDGNLTGDEENEIIDAIIGKFPLLGDLIDDNQLSVRGANSTWALGYRFTCMIGYNFGRKP